MPKRIGVAISWWWRGIRPCTLTAVDGCVTFVCWAHTDNSQWGFRGERPATVTKIMGELRLTGPDHRATSKMNASRVTASALQPRIVGSYTTPHPSHRSIRNTFSEKARQQITCSEGDQRLDKVQAAAAR
eukprot:gene10703-biopygen4382